MAKRNFNFKKMNLDLNGLRDTLTDTISTVADKVLDLADTAAESAKVGQQIAKLYAEKKKASRKSQQKPLNLQSLFWFAQSLLLRPIPMTIPAMRKVSPASQRFAAIRRKTTATAATAISWTAVCPNMSTL